MPARKARGLFASLPRRSRTRINASLVEPDGHGVLPSAPTPLPLLKPGAVQAWRGDDCIKLEHHQQLPSTPRTRAALVLQKAQERAAFGRKSNGRTKAREPTHAMTPRDQEARDLMHGVGGGDARQWIARAEETMIPFDAGGGDLDARVFVRSSGASLLCRPRQLKCRGDTISLQHSDELGEIVVRSVRSADPLKYELVLTVQAPSGALVEIVVRCLREAHFDTLVKLQ